MIYIIYIRIEICLDEQICILTYLHLPSSKGTRVPILTCILFFYIAASVMAWSSDLGLANLARPQIHLVSMTICYNIKCPLAKISVMLGFSPWVFLLSRIFTVCFFLFKCFIHFHWHILFRRKILLVTVVIRTIL